MVMVAGVVSDFAARVAPARGAAPQVLAWQGHLKVMVAGAGFEPATFGL